MVARDCIAGRLPKDVDLSPRISTATSPTDARAGVTSSASPARSHLRSTADG